MRGADVDVAELTAQIRQTLSQARMVPTVLDDAPAISLYLLSADFPQEALSPEEMHAALNEPAYWIFCWASGQALAQRILAQPELVRGKTVMDFGAGSGVVAVAAALAGAKRAIACDIDPVSLQASAANARLNGVDVQLCEDFFRWEESLDVLFAADVLYDKANRPFLDAFREKARHVVIADSRVKNLVHPGYVCTGEAESGTLPDLNEFDEFRRVQFYEAHGEV